MPLKCFFAATVACCCWMASADGEPVRLGTLEPHTGAAVPLEWTATNATATLADDALRLVPAAGKKAVLLAGPLLLRPLTLYDVSVEMQRGPGTAFGAQVTFKDATGQDGVRLLGFQLPDDSRPNWIPLSAMRQRYVAGFCLPQGAAQARLEFSLEGKPGSAWNYLDLYTIVVKEEAPVPFGPLLGPDLLGCGGMDRLNQNGAPLGWNWGGTPPPVELAVAAAPIGSYLHVRSTQGYPILCAPGVAVRRGHAYELAVTVRGHGDLAVLAHAMSDDGIYSERLGDAQCQSYPVNSEAWLHLRQVWLAEAVHVAAAQIYLQFNTTQGLDFGRVTFREIQEQKP